jgi:transposase
LDVPAKASQVLEGRMPQLVKRPAGAVRVEDRSDLSDADWALIEPELAAWRERRCGIGVQRRVHDLREIVNAIAYIRRTGIAWEYLPHDFPTHKTVYDYFAKWEKDGTAARITDALA